MLTVLFATGFWMLLATYLELPVSATHATVGGVIGSVMVARGPDAVLWWGTQEGFPWLEGVGKILIFWLVAPILTGLLAALLFLALRSLVLRRKHAATYALVVRGVGMRRIVCGVACLLLDMEVLLLSVLGTVTWNAWYCYFTCLVL